MIAPLLTAASPSIAAGQTPPRAAVAPCTVPGVGAARCGSVEVWENRAAGSGRKITLRFVVVPATGTASDDPVVPIAGGPGQATIPMASYVAEQFRELRQTRDILLTDARGTGTSTPIDCRLYGPSLPEYLGAFMPAGRVRRCAGEWAARADLARYTTDDAVDDLDDIRAALGYARLNLYGTSYGTRTALVYMRRHPQHVRSAILHGVAHTGVRMPSGLAPAAQASLDGVIGDCEREAACNAAFPALRDDLRAILGRLAAGPVQVTVADAETGEPVTIPFSRELFAEGLRYMLYTAGNAALIPTVLHQGAAGDLGPAAELAFGMRRRIVNDGSHGVYLSVTCAEDVPFVDMDAAVRASRGSFVGDSRLRDQAAACAAWPSRPVGRAFLEPVRSDVPVLILTGENDPATPPSQGNEALRTLPNGRHLVIPDGGHGLGGLVGVEPCVSRLMVGFIRTADAKGLDASCVASVHRIPFRTRPLATRTVEMSPAELAAYAGTFSALGAPPLETRVENGRLVAHVQGEGMTMLPVGGNEFRAVGEPDITVVFARQGGVATGVTVTGVAPEPIVYTRQ
ncbi:MAG TPA: alpha/beta hydrolase [Longimicrobium sp.]|nr:alpha/beta hydrolase [Longimicrobium sp.]